MAEAVATLEAQLASLQHQLAESKARARSSRACPLGRDDAAIPEATLVAMLQHEAQSRLNPATQQQYSEVEAANGDTSWMEVTEGLQRATVRAFGFGGSGDLEEAEAVAALRLAAPRYPEVAFWVRHNRARRGELTRNARVPAVALAPLQWAPDSIYPSGKDTVAMEDLVPLDARPLAVVALSYS